MYSFYVCQYERTRVTYKVVDGASTKKKLAIFVSRYVRILQQTRNDKIPTVLKESLTYTKLHSVYYLIAETAFNEAHTRCLFFFFLT